MIRPGCRSDVHAATQRAELDAVRLAAVDGQDRTLMRAAWRSNASQTWRRSSHGWGEHERLRCLLGQVEPGQDRQRERRRLAGAGLRQPDHVATRQQRRDGRGLDRGRRLVADVRERLEHRRSGRGRRTSPQGWWSSWSSLLTRPTVVVRAPAPPSSPRCAGSLDRHGLRQVARFVDVVAEREGLRSRPAAAAGDGEQDGVQPRSFFGTTTRLASTSRSTPMVTTTSGPARRRSRAAPPRCARSGCRRARSRRSAPPGRSARAARALFSEVWYARRAGRRIS